MKRPNILLFLTDDHGSWALGSYGNREVRSPNLDRLAAEGARFANVFTPCPVCSPARACLITGRTPSQVGIHDWIEENDPDCGDHDWMAAETGLPQLLQRAGYHCGLSGKWHLGRSHESPRGFDWCFGLPRHQGAHIETYTYHFNNEPLTLTGNKTGFITDYALRFLDETPDDKPFFLNVGYIATHSPYGGQEPDLVALYDDASFDDIPPYLPHVWRKNEGFVPDLDFDPAHRRDACANYYAAVTDIDRNVGRILDRLEAQGRLDETLVIYTSDHGLTLGHHGFWGKGNSTRPLNMYETSLRVPLLWRLPSAIEPQVVEPCIDHYDTFQTICHYAGVETVPGANYPGQDYSRLLRGESAVGWDETVFGEYGDLRMIRTPQWKLVHRYPAGPHDLFDLLNDPGETQNLSGDKNLADVEAELLARLEEFYAAHEDSSKSGLTVKQLRRHNTVHEAWRDGLREQRGLQVY